MPKIMSYKQGSIIFFAGDKDERIFILQSGKVDLKAADIVSGLTVSEQVVNGDFFGVKNALAKAPRIETARATTDCQTIMLTVEEFEKLFSPNKDAVSKMMAGFMKSLRALHYSIETVLQKPVDQLSREMTMINTAKAFFEEKRYYSAMSQCEKILRDVHDLQDKVTVDDLLAQSRLKTVSIAENEMRYSSTEETDESELRALKQFSAPVFDRFTKKFSDGEVILSEGTKSKSFYFVKSGEVLIEKCINGVMMRYGLVRVGEIFGDMEMVDGGNRVATATAKGAVSCLKFNKENFNSVVVSSPVVAILMLRILCRRIFYLRRNLEILCIKDLTARMSDIILLGVEREHSVGMNDEDMKRKVHYTVEDVAQIAGLPVDQTRDELNKLVSRNKIAIYNDYILVNNILDMKRTVDSYYANLEPSADKQPAQAQK